MEQIKHKIKYWWLSYYVRQVSTINTGGNVMNDVLLLKNGEVVAISGDVVALYKSMDDYNNNTQDYKSILRNND